MLRYLYTTPLEDIELTKEQALHKVLNVYVDCDATRDMLETVNRIVMRGGYIEVRDCDENGRIMCLMAGLTNITPFGYHYDEKGKRIEKKGKR